MKSNIVASLIERAAPEDDEDAIPSKAGKENVKKLIAEFKKLGIKLSPGKERDEFTAKGLEKLGAKKSEVTAKLRTVIAAAGWKSQGSGLFPDADDKYYFMASTCKNIDMDSQAVLSIGEGHLMAMGNGNW